jgi:hypothetical protein
MSAGYETPSHGGELNLEAEYIEARHNLQLAIHEHNQGIGIKDASLDRTQENINFWENRVAQIEADMRADGLLESNPGQISHETAVSRSAAELRLDGIEPAIDYSLVEEMTGDLEKLRPYKRVRTIDEISARLQDIRRQALEQLRSNRPE